MEVETKPKTLIDYIQCIEGWQMKLWDKAYIGVFKGVGAFKSLILSKSLGA